AAILIPLYFIPLGWIPNRVMTGPFAGQRNRPLSTRIWPCGSSALAAGSGFFGGGVTAARSLSAASGALTGGAGAGGFAAAWGLAADEAAVSGFSTGLGVTFSAGAGAGGFAAA